MDFQSFLKKQFLIEVKGLRYNLLLIFLIFQQARDLQLLSSKCQRWAFELCPLNFDDFIEQSEKLCTAQIVKVNRSVFTLKLILSQRTEFLRRVEWRKQQI